jgi:hypothetical protein
LIFETIVKDDSMIQRFVLLLIFSLTACNAEPPATDTVFVTATANIIFESPAQAQSIAGTDIPLEFSGGNPQVLSNLAPFEFTVTGDVNAKVNTGSIVYNFVAGTEGLSARDQLYLAYSDASSSQQITFQFHEGIIEGQYPINNFQTLVLGRVNAQYGYLVDDGSGSELQIYAEDVSGLFTVIKAGDTLSGEFEFTAHHTDAEGTQHQVLLIGSFSDVVYNRSADPFEVLVPLPTRGIVATDEP